MITCNSKIKRQFQKNNDVVVFLLIITLIDNYNELNVYMKTTRLCNVHKTFKLLIKFYMKYNFFYKLRSII